MSILDEFADVDFENSGWADSCPTQDIFKIYYVASLKQQAEMHQDLDGNQFCPFLFHIGLR